MVQSTHKTSRRIDMVGCSPGHLDELYEFKQRITLIATQTGILKYSCKWNLQFTGEYVQYLDRLFWGCHEHESQTFDPNVHLLDLMKPVHWKQASSFFFMLNLEKSADTYSLYDTIEASKCAHKQTFYNQNCAPECIRTKNSVRKTQHIHEIFLNHFQILFIYR